MKYAYADANTYGMKNRGWRSQHFKPLLDQGKWWFQKWIGLYVTVFSEVKRPLRNRLRIEVVTRL
jgi:hypothetical protein